MKKFASSLSNAQMAQARAFEKVGLTSLSQAVKAFERGETDRVNEWKKQLQAKQESK